MFVIIETAKALMLSAFQFATKVSWKKLFENQVLLPDIPLLVSERSQQIKM